MNTAFKLLSIIDSKEYTLNEIYQGQLYETALNDPNVSVEFLTLDEIKNNTTGKNPKFFDGVYCSLKVRNTITFCHALRQYLHDCPVIVQDYDPWCNFIDGSPWKGGYQKISNALNVKKFFVSAKFWSDMLNGQGLPSVPIKLGMLPKFVDSSFPFDSRTSFVEFRGSPHPDRVKGFECLRSAGIPVEWKASVKPYTAFLNELSKLKFWAHNESTPVMIEGNQVCANSLWPKALEVLSRGCFLIRDYQEESKWYDMDRLPTTLLFHNVAQSLGLLEKILAMPEKERNDRIAETTEFIRTKNYYGDIIRQIMEHSK